MKQCMVDHLLPYFSGAEASSIYSQYYLQNKFCTPNDLMVEMVEIMNINAELFQQLGVQIFPCYLFNTTDCLGQPAFEDRVVTV